MTCLALLISGFDPIGGLRKAYRIPGEEGVGYYREGPPVDVTGVTPQGQVFAGAWLKRPKPVVVEDLPTDIPDKADLIGRIGLLFNMVPLILETDSSRVISIMIQDHGTVPKVQGVNGSHHNLSHHGQESVRYWLSRVLSAPHRDC